MADLSYGPKVYRKQGAAEMVVADGGTITIESGGTLTLDDGSILNSTAGGFIVTNPDDATLEVSSSGVLRAKDRGIDAAKIADAVAGAAKPGVLLMHDITFTQTTTSPQTIDTTISYRLQVIDVSVLKIGGGSSATTVLTAQVQTATGGAISDAINMKGLDKAITRAGSIDDALQTVGTSVGGVIRVVRAGSIGAGTAGHNVQGIVRITGLKRST